jgi:hypothetical protein
VAHTPRIIPGLFKPPAVPWTSYPSHPSRRLLHRTSPETLAPPPSISWQPPSFHRQEAAREPCLKVSRPPVPFVSIPCTPVALTISPELPVAPPRRPAAPPFLHRDRRPRLPRRFVRFA